MSCLFKLHRDPPVPQSNALGNTDFSLAGKLLLTATALDSIIRNIWCLLLGCPFSAHHRCRHCNLHHTHSTSLFVLPTLQIRAAEVYCYFIKANAAMRGMAQAGYLVRHKLVQPNICVSTHHREKQLYYKLMRSLTLTNVLLGLCRKLALSQAQ